MLTARGQSQNPIRPGLGIIVNPVAGMGGRVALKGTDGPGTADEARSRGAVPVAAGRARRALLRLGAVLASGDIVTGSGDLGETLVRDLGVRPRLVGSARRSSTTADDTRRAAAAMRAAKVDLILVAGGDGTARDVFDVVGSGVPILGIPTGVKMHSAVFGTTPENAGDVARRFLLDPARACLQDREIMDVDDGLLAGGRLSARLYGYARVPYERSLVQHAKTGAPRNPGAALDALCRRIAHTLEPGSIYLFGPGTTTQTILRHAGIEGTLLGVDAVCDGRLVGADLPESAILALTEGRRTLIVVGVLGGQGFLLGRGNQQISAEVVARAGRSGITVVSTLDKIMALDGQTLLVDTGDPAVDAALCGYIRVETAPDHAILCKVVA